MLGSGLKRVDQLERTQNDPSLPSLHAGEWIETEVEIAVLFTGDASPQPSCWGVD